MNRFTIKTYYRFDECLLAFVTIGYIVWDKIANCAVDNAGKPVLDQQFITDPGDSISIIYGDQTKKFDIERKLMTSVARNLNQSDKEYQQAIDQFIKKKGRLLSPFL